MNKRIFLFVAAIVLLIGMLFLTFLPFQITDEYFPDGYEERFPDFIEAVKNMDSTFTYDIERGSPKEVVSEVWLLHPEILWLDNYVAFRQVGNQYELKLRYISSRMGARLKQFRLEWAVDSIANKAMKEPTEMDTLRYIHDAIVEKTDYTKFTPQSSTSYGCLIQKLALCQGYTNAFTMIARRCGIECGPVENPDHVWNYVILDGKEYMVDVTWDAPLYGTSNAYKYFMITPEEMKKDHHISKDYYQLYSKKSKANK